MGAWKARERTDGLMSTGHPPPPAQDMGQESRAWLLPMSYHLGRRGLNPTFSPLLPGCCVPFPGCAHVPLPSGLGGSRLVTHGRESPEDQGEGLTPGQWGLGERGVFWQWRRHRSCLLLGREEQQRRGGAPPLQRNPTLAEARPVLEAEESENGSCQVLPGARASNKTPSAHGRPGLCSSFADGPSNMGAAGWACLAGLLSVPTRKGWSRGGRGGAAEQ